MFYVLFLVGLSKATLRCYTSICDGIILLFRPLDDSGDDDNDKDDNGDDDKFDEVNEKDAHLSLQHVLLLEISFCICRHPGKRQDFGQHTG